MHAGKPAVFDAFIMHLDEVTRLPEGTPLLATNAHTPIQAAIFENGAASFWSTQYHPEYNLHEMGRLIAARAKALVREGFFPDEAAVATHAARMRELAANPGSAELRAELDVGDDIIDPQIREVELRNWLRFIDFTRGVDRPRHPGPSPVCMTMQSDVYSHSVTTLRPISDPSSLPPASGPARP